MSKGRTIETRTEEVLAPIAEANGVEIYDVEYVKEGSDWYLRAYIDKPEGVNILDCENPTSWMKRILLMMLIFWRSAARDWAGR